MTFSIRRRACRGRSQSGPAARWIGRSPRGWRPAVFMALLAGFWNAAVAAQSSGTVLPETLTFLNTATAVIEVEVAGQKTANSQTNLQLEFGPDGNSSTNPASDPQLGTTIFTVSAGFGGSHSFTPAGGTETQVFANKIVALQPLNPARAPGLYSLSVIHLQEIPAGKVETWKLEITGLPPSGMRAIGSVSQGTFKSLTPVGNIYQAPEIDLSPGVVSTGAVANLTLTARGLELSPVAEVSISPDDDVLGLGLHDLTGGNATVSFALSNSAAPGSRSLTIRQGNISLHQTFSVAQGPAIKIAGPTWITGPPGKATLNVTALSGADFSAVQIADISVWSFEFALDVPAPNVVAISNRDATNMTIALDNLGLDFGLFPLTLSIKTKAGALHGEFYARDHGGLQTCRTATEHCCKRPAGIVGRPDAICMSCLPKDQLCP